MNQLWLTRVFSLLLLNAYLIASQRFTYQFRYQIICNNLFQNSCFYHLIKDFKRKGICEGFSNPLNYPTSRCKTKPKFVNLGINSNGLPKFKTIIDGVCSRRTEQLLQRKDCEFVLHQQSNLIFKNLLFLMMSMCRSEIYNQWNIFPIQTTRLVPLHSVMELENATISTNLNLGNVTFVLSVKLHKSIFLENSRNRYPWICSLRSKKKSKKHHCAVTLLSRPPAPTVLVGPAHCTYICKSSRVEVDNCCCGGLNNCSEDVARCGNGPRVVEVTGEDAEIICGEWETGSFSPIASGEKYNVILNIKDVICHPDYTVNTDSSAHIKNDIAVFKVDDSVLSSMQNRWKIYPACLPTERRTSRVGYHSGWSSPIPFHILRQYAVGFTKVYRDFFKQIHHRMEILGKCEDDNFFTASTDPVNFPTNTYYPPGESMYI